MFGFCCDDVVVSGDNIVVGWVRCSVTSQSQRQLRYTVYSSINTLPCVLLYWLSCFRLVYTSLVVADSGKLWFRYDPLVKKTFPAPDH